MILEAVTNIPITETISNHNLSCVSPRKKKIYIYICNIIYILAITHILKLLQFNMRNIASIVLFVLMVSVRFESSLQTPPPHVLKVIHGKS